MTSAIYRKYKDKEYCNIEVNIREYRNLNKLKGRIINATISKEANGKYYVSIMCELLETNKVNAYYPSSQLCSVCNAKNTKYKDLNERTYNCNNCHNTLDRYLNTSINIMFEVLKMYMKDDLA